MIVLYDIIELVYIILVDNVYLSSTQQNVLLVHYAWIFCEDFFQKIPSFELSEVFVHNSHTATFAWFSHQYKLNAKFV